MTTLGLILLGWATPATGAEVDGNTPQRLAADKGCVLCHMDKPAKSDANPALANAPSWPEIAQHYRGRADAEEHLVGIVLGGSIPDQRHWRGQVAYTSMWPNAAGVTRDEARTIVRWILAFEGAARLAGDRGCTLCHREAPSPRDAGDAPPLAPTWREIAARYRSSPDAETRLTRTVLEGADPKERHWKDRLEFNQMGANAGQVAPDEARALVRWILATP